MSNVENAGARAHHIAVHHDKPRLLGTPVLRWIAWSHVFFGFAYLLENFLVIWQGWPGSVTFLSQMGILGREMPEGSFVLSLICFLLYIAAFALAYLFVYRDKAMALRPDSLRMAGLNNYLIRACFWAVLFVGLVDIIISFMRVEELLVVVFGEDLASGLARAAFRGAYVHVPLIVIGFVIALFTRTLGFHWLALLVVVAELTIVIGRFVFSYEQAFQGDLVRFWYAALFLFASAYTLFEDGHVRVDVLYSTFERPLRGTVNAVGSVGLGIVLCWVVIYFGMADKASIINSPIINYEVSQSGFGMYVKSWMAGFLAIFAVSMNIQFTSYLLESVADRRGEPGAREITPVAH